MKDSYCKPRGFHREEKRCYRRQTDSSHSDWSVPTAGRTIQQFRRNPVAAAHKVSSPLKIGVRCF
jgi:hypothetical protein